MKIIAMTKSFYTVINKLILTFFLLFVLIKTEVYSQISSKEISISVSDFGAIPDDSINDRSAINKALIHCKENNMANLFFPPGKYILEHPDAVALMNDVMNLKMGENPAKTIFKPYYKYIKGLDISGHQNLRLTGYGVELICKGWMEPISIENSGNITVKGFTIDYHRQPHSEGKVIQITDEYFDVKFTEEYPVKSNMVMPRIMFFDVKKDRLESEPVYFPEKNKLISPQTLRIWAKIPGSYLKDYALINHSFHFRPAVLIHESKDVNVIDVTIHSQPGMGIVGHRSHNILMSGLRVVPRPGRRQSTNTDATHFTSCTGYIHFRNCMFEGQGDDATNVHNYYYTITGMSKNKYITKILNPSEGTHAMVLDYPDVGDTLELVNKSTLKPVKEVIVADVDTFPDKWETHIGLNEELPADLDPYFLINISRLPRLHIEGCTILSHLARGILIKTRNVLIENNTIMETTGTGIQIGAEGYWHEGPGSENVVIRNNRIIRCGLGDGTQKETSGIVVSVGSPDPAKYGVHKNLIFENNIIEGENARYGIYVTGSDDVKIRYNQISGCEIPVYVE
ncbi:MAG: right-handed parallel beta-helix repeat-containing protein [Bacteroidales bacterium]|nr:right-handed parallel beta-helix repeat-containing protein [Bacteroidales bacterium]